MAMTRAQYDALHFGKANQSLMTNGYRVILTPHFEKREGMTLEELSNIDRLNNPIEFDTVDSHSLTSTSTITNQPIVNGDTIADHMIREPLSVSLSGIFSLYGNKPTKFPGGEDRLANIENLFEKIKNEGIFCSIVMMNRNKANKQRFKVRNNLVLTNIQWTYNQASISYNFTFNEAITINVEIPEVDYTDENLPAITDGLPLNFTDTLLDMNEVDSIVLKQLDNLKLLSNDFINFFVSYGQNYISGATIGAIAAGTIATLVGSWIAGGLVAIGPAGWITIGVIAIAGAFIAGIVAFFNGFNKRKAEKEFGIKAFKLYEDDKKNAQEVERFSNYVGTIHKNLQFLNEFIQVYGIGSSINQECMIYIDDTYYIFTFNKNNVANNGDKVIWSCHIENAEGSFKDDFNVSNSSFSNTNECKANNCLFRGTNGSYVYFLNNKLFAIENGTYNSEEERQKAITKCKSDLTSYYILVTKLKMEDFNKKLQEVIIDAMKM